MSHTLTASTPLRSLLPASLTQLALPPPLFFFALLTLLLLLVLIPSMCTLYRQLRLLPRLAAPNLRAELAWRASYKRTRAALTHLLCFHPSHQQPIRTLFLHLKLCVAHLPSKPAEEVFTDLFPHHLLKPECSEHSEFAPPQQQGRLWPLLRTNLALLRPFNNFSKLRCSAAMNPASSCSWSSRFFLAELILAASLVALGAALIQSYARMPINSNISWLLMPCGLALLVLCSPRCLTRTKRFQQSSKQSLPSRSQSAAPSLPPHQASPLVYEYLSALTEEENLLESFSIEEAKAILNKQDEKAPLLYGSEELEEFGQIKDSDQPLRSGRIELAAPDSIHQRLRSDVRLLSPRKQLSFDSARAQLEAGAKGARVEEIQPPTPDALTPESSEGSNSLIEEFGEMDQNIISEPGRCLTEQSISLRSASLSPRHGKENQRRVGGRLRELQMQHPSTLGTVGLLSVSRPAAYSEPPPPLTPEARPPGLDFTLLSVSQKLEYRKIRANMANSGVTPVQRFLNMKNEEVTISSIQSQTSQESPRKEQHQYFRKPVSYLSVKDQRPPSWSHQFNPPARVSLFSPARGPPPPPTPELETAAPSKTQDSRKFSNESLSKIFDEPSPPPRRKSYRRSLFRPNESFNNKPVEELMLQSSARQRLEAFKDCETAPYKIFEAEHLRSRLLDLLYPIEGTDGASEQDEVGRVWELKGWQRRLERGKFSQEFLTAMSQKSIRKFAEAKAPWIYEKYRIRVLEEGGAAGLKRELMRHRGVLEHQDSLSAKEAIISLQGLCHHSSPLFDSSSEGASTPSMTQIFINGRTQSKREDHSMARSELLLQNFKRVSQDLNERWERAKYLRALTLVPSVLNFYQSVMLLMGAEGLSIALFALAYRILNKQIEIAEQGGEGSRILLEWGILVLISLVVGLLVLDAGRIVLSLYCFRKLKPGCCRRALSGEIERMVAEEKTVALWRERLALSEGTARGGLVAVGLEEAGGGLSERVEEEREEAVLQRVEELIQVKR